MSATVLFYLLVASGWVLILVGLAVLSRAAGIDDWRPRR